MARANRLRDRLPQSDSADVRALQGEELSVMLKVIEEQKSETVG